MTNSESIYGDSVHNLGKEPKDFVPIQEVSYNAEDSELGLTPDEILVRKEEAEEARKRGEELETAA